MIDKQRISLVFGVVGLFVFATGAALYAINSPHRIAMYASLGTGLALLVLYTALNQGVIRRFLGRRTSRYGANMVIMIVLFACIAVVVQAISIRHSARYDLTRNKRFTLAEQTRNIVRNLNDDVTLYAFYSQGSDERYAAEDLLSQYGHESDHIRYEFIDPDRSPQRAKAMDITNHPAIVVAMRDKTERVSEASEAVLTNAILKLTRDEKKLLYFVIGHGEKDPESEETSGYSIAADELGKQNYEVRKLSLFEEAEVPSDAAVLIVAGPEKDYFPSEITKIRRFLARGKNAVFLLDPQDVMPNIESFLEEYRALVEQDIIIDPNSRVFGGSYTVPVVTNYVEHPITRSINMATFFPMARSVHISAADVPGVSCQYLALAGKSAWGETDLEGIKEGEASRTEADILPPIAVAMISTKRFEDRLPSAEGPDVSKLVLVGDSDFADNSAFRISGNGDFFLNVVNYLAEEKDLISLRSKKALGDRLFLTASQGRLIFLLCVVLLPFSVIVFGSTVFIRGRREA